MIDINLGNLHLEVVGKEPDGFPHRAKAGTPWRLKQRGRGRRAWGGEKRTNVTLLKYAITITYLLIFAHDKCELPSSQNLLGLLLTLLACKSLLCIRICF